ncbi:MAG: hypothetical protein ACE5D4_10150 [Thermodesulfobacteriota bacterium]
MNSQASVIGTVKRVKRHGRSFLGDRRIYPSQEAQQALNGEEKQPTLLYDSRISERLEQLRRDVVEIERRIRRYNTPVSMDNFI